jgi:hypothetical protein
MKSKLLGGAALAIALAVSSGAWANPKNSFSNFNYTSVYSTAVAVSTGHNTINSGNGGAGGDGVFDFGLGGEGGDGKVENGDSWSESEAVSESFNVSIEAVEVSSLSAYSAFNYVYNENKGDFPFDVFIEWRDAVASASGDGHLHQAQANNGVGSVNAATQSVAAAAEVRF